LGKRYKKERDDRKVSAAVRKISVKGPNQGKGKRRRNGRRRKKPECRQN
jgi:hypothetical protein